MESPRNQPAPRHSLQAYGAPLRSEVLELHEWAGLKAHSKTRQLTARTGNRHETFTVRPFTDHWPSLASSTSSPPGSLICPYSREWQTHIVLLESRPFVPRPVVYCCVWRNNYHFFKRLSKNFEKFNFQRLFKKFSKCKVFLKTFEKIFILRIFQLFRKIIIQKFQ